MPKLFDAKGNLIDSGVHPGMPNQPIPLWERSQNILFRDGAAKVGPAQVPLFTKLSSSRVLGMASAVRRDFGASPVPSDSPSLIWGDAIDLYRGNVAPTTENVTRVSGGPYAATPVNQWSIVAYGNTILATNGIDEVQVLLDINTGSFTNMTDTAGYDAATGLPDTFRCKTLAVIGAFIVAFNTNQSGDEIRWSNEDEPLVWIPTAENLSRDIQARALGSDIVAVQEFADQLAIYGRDAIHTLDFVGPPFFFATSHLIDGLGVSGKHAVTEVGRMHYAIGPNGIFVTDGSTKNYIDAPSMHRHVYEDTLDLDKLPEAISWFDPNEQEVYFSYPSTENPPGETVAFNVQNSNWSMHSFYRTAATKGGLWDSPVVGDDQGNIWIQGPTSAAVTTGQNPMAILDTAGMATAYGALGYGQNGYGGLGVIE